MNGAPSIMVVGIPNASAFKNESNVCFFATRLVVASINRNRCVPHLFDAVNCSGLTEILEFQRLLLTTRLALNLNASLLLKVKTSKYKSSGIDFEP